MTGGRCATVAFEACKINPNGPRAPILTFLDVTDASVIPDMRD